MIGIVAGSRFTCSVEINPPFAEVRILIDCASGVKYSFGRWIRTGLHDEVQRPTFVLHRKCRWLFPSFISTLAKAKAISFAHEDDLSAAETREV